MKTIDNSFGLAPPSPRMLCFRRRFWIILVFSISLIILNITGCNLIFPVDDQVVGEYVSPNEDYVIAIVVRNVGMTAPYATHILFREFDQKTDPDRNCQILVLRHEWSVGVQWTGPDSVTIQIPADVPKEDYFWKDSACWDEIVTIDFQETAAEELL